MEPTEEVVQAATESPAADSQPEDIETLRAEIARLQRRVHQVSQQAAKYRIRAKEALKKNEVGQEAPSTPAEAEGRHRHGEPSEVSAAGGAEEATSAAEPAVTAEEPKPQNAEGLKAVTLALLRPYVVEGGERAAYGELEGDDRLTVENGVPMLKLPDGTIAPIDGDNLAAALPPDFGRNLLPGQGVGGTGSRAPRELRTFSLDNLLGSQKSFEKHRKLISKTLIRIKGTQQ